MVGTCRLMACQLPTHPAIVYFWQTFFHCQMKTEESVFPSSWSVVLGALYKTAAHLIHTYSLVVMVVMHAHCVLLEIPNDYTNQRSSSFLVS